jgi:hypothetical protein
MSGSGQHVTQSGEVARVDFGGRREGQKQALVGQKVIEHATQEGRVAGDLTKLRGGSAAEVQEALKAGRLLSQKMKRSQGDDFGFCGTCRSDMGHLGEQLTTPSG